MASRITKFFSELTGVIMTVREDPQSQVLEDILLDLWIHSIDQAVSKTVRLGFLIRLFMDPPMAIFGHLIRRWSRILVGALLFFLLPTQLLDALGIGPLTYTLIMLVAVDIEATASFLVSILFAVLEILFGGAFSRALARGLRTGHIVQMVFGHTEATRAYITEHVGTSMQTLPQVYLSQHDRLLDVYFEGTDSEKEKAFADYWTSVGREPTNWFPDMSSKS